jgi:hypothetical protein
MARVAVIAFLFLAWALPAHPNDWGVSGANYIKVWQSSEREDVPEAEKKTFFMDKGFFIGFTFGVAESLNGVLYSLPSGATGAQVNAVVEKYLKEHPEKWNWNARMIIAAALAEAFPKSDK